MQKLLLIVLTTLTLFSCSKEKRAALEGNWQEVAFTSTDATGAMVWTNLSPSFPYPNQFNFKSDGTYSAKQEYLLNEGTFSYDYSAHQLTLKKLPSGTVENKAAILDENYLVIDIVSNGEIVGKRKFIRN